MKRRLNILTYLYAIFLILLFLSGSIVGFVGDLVYLLAFALPIGVGMYLTRKEGFDVRFSVNKERLKFILPLIMPTVSTVIILSYVTSFIIYLTTGRTNSVDLGDSFFLALISHALMPAILEELLFRYLPIRMLSGKSERMTVFASAFFFAFVHHDLFSIPYAFAAGIAFMAIDLVTGSIFPSILIHFINNAMSVCVIFFDSSPYFSVKLYSVIFTLTVMSLVFIFKDRKRYKEAAEFVFLPDGEKGITPDMLIFGVTMLMIAIFSLIF